MDANPIRVGRLTARRLMDDLELARDRLARGHAAFAAVLPGRAGEESLGTATTEADHSALSTPLPSGSPSGGGIDSIRSGAVPSPAFPTSFLLPEAAFVLGIPDRTLGELIAKDFATTLVTEDGRRFMTRAQLDRLDDLIGIVERGIKAMEVAA